MKAYRVWVDEWESCITFSTNRRAAKWNAMRGLRAAGYYEAGRKSEQRKFPSKLKVRRAPEYDDAPMEDREKKLRRTYQEEYIKGLFEPKRQYFFAAADGSGGLMVVDRNGKPIDYGRIVGRIVEEI